MKNENEQYIILTEPYLGGNQLGQIVLKALPRSTLSNAPQAYTTKRDASVEKVFIVLEKLKHMLLSHGKC